MAGGIRDQTSRHHSSLASTPARGIDRQHDLGQIGQGFTRIRTADRRVRDELAATSGGLDHGYVEVRFVDPVSGEVYLANEGKRLFLPISQDWNAATVDSLPALDGVAHPALLDGMATIFPGAPSEFSPDVGRSQGTEHLPSEKLPILPGEIGRAAWRERGRS